ncbi:MAG: lipopolysaccharide biosynthesis protein [Pseudomonadota bacterium]
MINDSDLKISQRTARGAIVTIGSQVLLAAMQLINMVVLARLLSPADFGLIAMSTAVVASIALFRDLGLSAATIQQQHLDQDTASGLFFVNIGTALVLMLLICIAAPFVAALLNDPRLTATIIASSGTLPITALGAQHRAQFARNLQFFTTQWIAVAGAAAGSVGAILSAAYGVGYWALLINAWIAAVSQMILLWVWSRWRPTRVHNWSRLRSSIDFGISVTVSDLIIYFSRQFDKLLVGYRWGGEELGFYSRAYAVLLMPQNLISGPISATLLPGLSRLQNQPAEWRDLLLSAVQITSILTMFVAALLILNAEEMVAIVLGAQWGASADLVEVFGISMIARAVMSQNPWIYLSLGDTKRMIVWQLTTLPVYLGGIFIGLPYGVEGVAIGFSVAQLLLCLPSVFVAAAGTPVSGGEILRIVWPVGVVTLITILASPLLCTPIKGEAFSVTTAMESLAITSLVFVAGTGIVLWIDPKYRRLKVIIVRWGVGLIWRMFERRGKSHSN